MVLSDSVSLKIAVPKHSRSTAYCSFDGKSRKELRQGDYVTVEASQYPFPTVVAGKSEWFDSVRRALRWNTRGAVQRAWGAPQTNGHDADPAEAPLPQFVEIPWEHEDDDWDIEADEDIGHPRFFKASDNP
ncbi:NAD(+) kinase, partial [Ascosphaera atra]